MSLFKCYTDIAFKYQDPKDAIAFLQSYKLLANNPICSLCIKDGKTKDKATMVLRKVKKINKQPMKYACFKHNKTIGLYTNSFFNNSKLTPLQIIELLHYWVMGKIIYL